jgi:hypothetical protein
MTIRNHATGTVTIPGYSTQTKRNFAADETLKNSPASPRFQSVAAAKRRVKYGATGDFQRRQLMMAKVAVAAADSRNRRITGEN